VLDDLLLPLVRALPQNAVSRLAGHAAELPLPAVVWHPLIRLFAGSFGVNLAEAERPVTGYSTLADFFARRLKPGLRPLDPDPAALVSPTDGVIRSCGRIDGATLEQIKGIRYSLDTLLLDPDRAGAFRGGSFATFYLSPRDYHRIHAPLDGRVTGYQYVPGGLLPVNSLTIDRVPGLFTLNERLVAYLDTDAGRVAVVMIGAMIVGRVRVTFDEVQTNDPGGKMVYGESYDAPVAFERGEELGSFEFGSTVVLLFERDRVELDGFDRDAPILVGQRVGRIL